MPHSETAAQVWRCGTQNAKDHCIVTTYLPTDVLTYMPTYLPRYLPTWNQTTHVLATMLGWYARPEALSYLPTYFPCTHGIILHGSKRTATGPQPAARGPSLGSRKEERLEAAGKYIKKGLEYSLRLSCKK